MFQVKQREEGQVTIIELEGRLDAVASPQLEKTLHAVLTDGKSLVILELNNLEFVASAGLRVFLAFAKMIKKADGTFAFCGLSDDVFNVFKITGFTDIFPVLPTCDEALQSVS